MDDFERCYRAVQSRDPRFDGWFVTAVTSTRIYCRPSCPARTPKRANVCFYPTAAAAQGAGFRACKRCRPDATPGSPEWNVRADLVARAMRLIADGVVDREGVSGLAARLGYSERHLHRQLVAEVGAGAIALARAQRAQTARILIETTTLPFTEVAFAAGFSSIRQFNDVVMAVFATTPSNLRRRGAGTGAPTQDTVALRLPFRAPCDAAATLRFLAARATPGVEAAQGDRYTRSLSLPRGAGVVELTPAEGYVACKLHLDDLRDLAAAVERCRRLLDLDADPAAIADLLGADPHIGPLVRRRPGLRSPGAVDGAEQAFRAILGQQVSVPAARTLAGRIVERCGKPLTRSHGQVTHAFPDAGALAGVDPAALPLPDARRRTLLRLAELLADGALVIDPGADRGEVETRLRALRGIGPWTAGYIRMRALGDPDVFLGTDLGVRAGLRRVRLSTELRRAMETAQRWRPWRSYAVHHLWTAHRSPTRR
jgi:AraC family transcriptional regulator, regulatory protein of adaptative response / DNA-3-methyladenine glycosylase II